MDYGRILKRAWTVTWRYRILWIFGLFAGGVGGSGGGGGGNSGYSSDFGKSGTYDTAWVNNAVDQAQQYIWLIVLAVSIAVVVGLALWVLSVAARGGLIHLVNEAEENRPVRAADGWSAGFRYWTRIFAVDLVLYLPFTILLLLLFGMAFAPLVIAGINGTDPTAGVFSLCGGAAFAVLIAVVLGFVIGLLEMMASRHVVLGDERAMHSISLAWRDLRARFKDLFVMWLISLAVGMAYGLAIGVFAAIFAVGMGVSIAAGIWVVAGVIGFVMFLVLLVPTAIFGTFSSAIWTIFYRQMTGMDAVQQVQASPVQPGYTPLAPDAPAYPDAAPQPSPYPAPPVPPAPPAPPSIPPVPGELPPTPPSAY